MLIGYARVSTAEQETHAQLDALTKAGCECAYQEKRSGGNMARPQLQLLLRSLRPGNTVVVYKLDRIARSLKDLLTIIERIEEKGAEFQSLTERFDTKSPAGRMIFQIVGAFAEFERELIRERTRVGMAAAIKRGVKMGRPRAVNENDILTKMRSGKHTKSALAREYDCDVSSIKCALKRVKQRAEPELQLVA
jgi:DNA invertase Pin-like site-specific DNA recombinase